MGRAGDCRWVAYIASSSITPGMEAARDPSRQRSGLCQANAGYTGRRVFLLDWTVALMCNEARRGDTVLIRHE